MKKSLVAISLLALAPAADAHEMFLRPKQAVVAPNGTVVIDLINGTFDKSENPITRDRMTDVTVSVGGKSSKPSATQWTDDATASHLRMKVDGPGTYAIGLSTKPKALTMSAADFAKYLQHDGIEDMIAQRKLEKAPSTPVTERYSKHVRAIVQVGTALTDDAARPMGYPTELLLLNNPATLKSGGTLKFRALYRGKPLANQLVYGSYEGHHGHSVTGGHINAAKVRTGADGTAMVKITHAGNWYLTMINMRKVNEPGVNYESNWSTVTFQVR